MLLTELYPRNHRHYASLPIVGTMLAGYARWLFDQGYPKHRVRQHFRAANRLVSLLHNIDVHVFEDLTRERLRACAPACSQDDPELAVLVRLLDRYLETTGVFSAPSLTRIEGRLAAYRTYLKEVRGFALSTVASHTATIAELLEHLGYEQTPARLNALSAADIESFVCKVGERLSRATFQHSVAHLRTFIRFLETRGEACTGLDMQIDTPRVYRLCPTARSSPGAGHLKACLDPRLSPSFFRRGPEGAVWTCLGCGSSAISLFIADAGNQTASYPTRFSSRRNTHQCFLTSSLMLRSQS